MASWWHTLAMLALMFGSMAIALALNGAGSPVGAPQAISQRHVLPTLLQSLAFDWGALYFAWVGVHWRNGSFLTLAGRRWRGWRDVARDALIAAPFWAVWEAAAWAVWKLVGRPLAAQDSIFPVRGPIEIPVWITLSLSAGFCEELIFRGYLQRQLSALTGSTGIGVLLQGVLFGLMHPRGWKAVTVISVLGVLYGALAAWRRDLKPGMLAHAWSDLWEGWLKFV